MSRYSATILLIIVLLLVFCVLLLASYISFCKACIYKTEKREHARDIPDSDLYRGYQDKLCAVVDEIALCTHENVSITSYDGLKLYGTLIERDKQAPTLISFHGYHGTYAWDGYGAYNITKKMNYNILMVDMRAHGKSEGNLVTFGIRERFDCRDWVNFVIQRFGQTCEIILSGVSMGGATVLLATELGLPDNVRLVISDCGYTDAGKMQKEMIRKLRIPAIIYVFIKIGARLFGHFNLEETSPIKAVATMKLPIIFIHGDKDSIVPISMESQLFDSCGSKQKEKVVVPGANHANSALVNYAFYEDKITGFMQKAMQ